MKKLILALILVLCAAAFAEVDFYDDEGIDEEYWVFVKSGENAKVEMIDSRDNSVISTLYNGDSLKVLGQTKQKYTVGGVTERWYYVRCNADIEPFYGWVFGGYLYGYASDKAYYAYVLLLNSKIHDIDFEQAENMSRGAALESQKKPEEFESGVSVKTNRATLLWIGEEPLATSDKTSVQLSKGTKLIVKEVFKSDYDITLGSYDYPYYVVSYKDGTEGIINGIYLEKE